MIIRAAARLIQLYRLTLSPAIQLVFDVRCRYEVSCSHYVERALNDHGVVRGSWLGLRRVLSCSKWSGNG